MADINISNSECQAAGTLNRIHLSIGFFVLAVGVYLGGVVFQLLCLR